MVGSMRELTDRQRDVMQRIDRRMSIKVIAQDLGMSETRVNQHIRALKDIFQTENLPELVEQYRKSILHAPNEGKAARLTVGSPFFEMAAIPRSTIPNYPAEPLATGLTLVSLHPVVELASPWKRLLTILGLFASLFVIALLITYAGVSLEEVAANLL